MEIVKRLLKKAAETNSDPHLALLTYRSSPLGCGASPSELLMNRKLRNTLPHMPRQEKHRGLTQKRMQLKWEQKKNHDKTARNLKPLTEHDVVRIEEPHGWNRKAVVLKEVSPRSYTVRTEDGQVFRRNRRSLLKTQEPWQKTSHAEVTGSPNAHPGVQPTKPQRELTRLGTTVCRKSIRVRKQKVVMDM